MDRISSAEVGMKITEWYHHIQKFNVTDAEILKAEIEKDIEVMEEDQDLLLYYQLMAFRHSIMIEYIVPSGEKQMELSEYLKRVEGNKRKLDHMLTYYYNFFRGMYEFRKGEYTKAITYYKKAEREFPAISDSIEKAEFSFKMAEVYYHMKMTHVSMHYAELAYQIYKKHELYSVRLIQCHFVIAGNYDDLENHEKALPHLNQALRSAELLKKKNPHIYATAFYNLGNCYHRMDNLNKAARYIEHALIQYKKLKSNRLPQVYHDLALIYFKQNQYEKAVGYYRKGIRCAVELKDDLFMSLFEALDSLYLKQGDTPSLYKIFARLETSKGFPYLEELALLAGTHLDYNGKIEDSIICLKKMVYAQKQILKGECLYEV
ncbi:MULTISPECIES: response regulator aspartate phosphatase [Bacillus]|uniref:response regulator aspartate phosphatase n=1 Tax=Bacillus TaxID=1386 RepID=UPI00115158C2|nr:tetratricopeptide repeat protein [Bacillus sonorensis]